MALPLNKDETEPKAEQQHRGSGSGPATSALTFIRGGCWVKHWFILALLSPSPLAYLSIYLCMGVCLQDSLAVKTKYTALYRREEHHSSIPVLALAQGLRLASGTAEICLALRKMIYGASAWHSACLRCLSCQRGACIVHTAVPGGVWCPGLKPMVLFSRC